jgi:hypothetical protein
MLTKKRSKKMKKKTIKAKRKKIYKTYGPDLRYLIFDGKNHVFKFVG